MIRLLSVSETVQRDSRLDRVIDEAISGRTFSLSCATDVPHKCTFNGIEILPYAMAYHKRRWRWLKHSCSKSTSFRHVRLAKAVLSKRFVSHCSTIEIIIMSLYTLASMYSLRCEPSIGQLQIEGGSGLKEDKYLLKVCDTVCSCLSGKRRHFSRPEGCKSLSVAEDFIHSRPSPLSYSAQWGHYYPLALTHWERAQTHAKSDQSLGTAYRHFYGWPSSQGVRSRFTLFPACTRRSLLGRVIVVDTWKRSPGN